MNPETLHRLRQDSATEGDRAVELLEANDTTRAAYCYRNIARLWNEAAAATGSTDAEDVALHARRVSAALRGGQGDITEFGPVNAAAKRFFASLNDDGRGAADPEG